MLKKSVYRSKTWLDNTLFVDEISFSSTHWLMNTNSTNVYMQIKPRMSYHFIILMLLFRNAEKVEVF
jgi:nucleoside-specific outer membrane channel protein Tsx